MKYLKKTRIENLNINKQLIREMFFKIELKLCVWGKGYEN